ncbi:BolA/IbaG family iron-sulfur metabolism protein [Candidatus Pelagibacter sp.]|nr:BolA/IbaG family iron-sulfur metabolism protein [Candidatus Pelagibacter sp.]
MDINQLIEIVKKKICVNLNIEQIEIQDKTYLHIKHSTHQKDKFHIKIFIKSKYLLNEKKIETTRKIYKILDHEIKKHIHSIQLKIN